MRKNLFFRLAMMMAIVCMAVACSQEAEILVPSQQPSEDGMYHYDMYLDCEAPSFDDNTDSRSVSYDKWENNNMLLIRFKSGSKWIVGEATYNKSENIWNVDTYETLPTITGEETCEVYYFTQAVGYNSTQVTMNEKTACYMTKSGKYSHPTATSIGLSAVLDKMTWRMRFKGSSGTTITLPADKNDIKFYSNFNLGNASFSTGAKEISLTVASDGYTPYIYGVFIYSGTNVMTVYNGSNGYTREITADKLKVGESGYFNIPTSSSYTGWTEIAADAYTKNLVNDPNLYSRPDLFMTLSGGFGCSWTTGSNTVYTYNRTIKKSEADSYTDLELYEKIISVSKTEGMEKYISWNDNLSPNTDYYICTVSMNASNQHSAIYKYSFRTASDLNQPLAQISNLRATVNSDGVKKWSMDVTLSNTSKYYIIDDNRFFDDDDYYYAWCCYKWITDGSVTYTYDFEGGVSWNRNDETQTTVLTWALASNGGLSGQVSVARATSYTSRANDVQIVPENVIVKEDGSKCINKNLTPERPRITEVHCF